MPVLENRNVYIKGDRTSMKLEPLLWDLLGRIAAPNDVASQNQIDRVVTKFISTHGQNGGSHTSAVRTGIVKHFADAITELEQRVVNRVYIDL